MRRQTFVRARDPSIKKKPKGTVPPNNVKSQRGSSATHDARYPSIRGSVRFLTIASCDLHVLLNIYPEDVNGVSEYPRVSDQFVHCI
jgi:hypothetical protein